MKNELLQFLLLSGFGVSLWAILKREYNKDNNNTSNNYRSMDNVYLDIEKLPRGYRNNNPLNIRYSPQNNWVGQALPNTDGIFAQFTSLAYGYRAAFVLLRNYINNYNTNTIEKIINKWAPPADNNNTSGYINNVCKLTDFLPTTVINPYNYEQMTSLVYAMSISENGNIPLPDADAINKGWNLYIA